MGRIRFLLYKISQLLPKGQRRPVILISSILGLFIFFQFMTRISDSYLLLSVQQVFRDTWKALQDEQVGGLTIVFICAILGYGGYRYYGLLCDHLPPRHLAVHHVEVGRRSMEFAVPVTVPRAVPTYVPNTVRYMSHFFAMKSFI